VPPKPKRMSWPTHLYRLLVEHHYELDLTGDLSRPTLRFSQMDFDDLVGSMEKYFGQPIETGPSIQTTVFGCPVIVE
jgi:hypothetical protein